MDKQKVEVKGEGLINSAVLEWGTVPFADLPVLRGFPCFGRKVSFLYEDGKGGIKLPEEESPLTVLQKGDKVYLTSMKRVPVNPELSTITLQYLVRTASTERISIIKPRVIGEITTSTNEGKVIADFLYDGNGNIPALVFHFPMYNVGYEGRLPVEYSKVDAVDLESSVRNNLMNYGKNIDTVIVYGKKLVGVTVPASKIPELIEKTKSSDLKKVFYSSDLERVAELNRKNDRDHMTNCWGDHSCISTETFEFVQPKGYPQYRVAMDTKGKIYEAERILGK